MILKKRGGGVQYITAFPIIIKSKAGVHTTHPGLFDISAAITEQSPSLHYLSPGFFTVNKPQDKCLHSKVTAYLFKPYFHSSELKVNLIILLLCFQAEKQIGAVLSFYNCSDWRNERNFNYYMIYIINIKNDIYIKSENPRQ